MFINKEVVRCSWVYIFTEVFSLSDYDIIQEMQLNFGWIVFIGH